MSFWLNRYRQARKATGLSGDLHERAVVAITAGAIPLLTTNRTAITIESSLTMKAIA